MTRRQLLGSAAAVAAAPRAVASSKAVIETRILRLKLRHTWTTVMSSSDYRDTLEVRYTRDGITGIGEGAPIVRYKEDAEGAQRAVQSVRGFLESADPLQYRKTIAETVRRIDGNWAAKSAIDIAVMDWVGQKLGVPLYRLFGLDARDAPVTTFSIGIDTPEVTRQKVKEAGIYPVLKVKVGLDKDEQTIESIRSVTDKPLRADANEGWKTKEEAARKIEWLAKRGVEFVEQPMAASMFEEHVWLKSRAALPVIADESVHHPSDIPRLAAAYHGINVKLDKCGGTLEAVRMIEMAKSLGMKTMLGCMISSSVTCTAAAHISPLVDWADIDGPLLIANDPFEGVQYENGRLILPSRPGLGLKART
jgi:L-alanine-DL-glutamate epimerase-like enolase superfamily enzyme